MQPLNSRIFSFLNEQEFDFVSLHCVIFIDAPLSILMVLQGMSLQLDNIIGSSSTYWT
jgi:hypothetical protein